MVKIIKNTYPEKGIGKHTSGTLCVWVQDGFGWLNLHLCDDNGKPKEKIFTHGQCYARNGNLLSGKKEPSKVGTVAKYVKNGWELSVEHVKIGGKS